MLRIGLYCGHNGVYGKMGDNGAVNQSLTPTWEKTDGLGTEFSMVKHVVAKTWERCTDMENVRVVLSHRGIEKGSYGKLPDEINDLDVDIIIEVHLNAVDNTAVDGTECLYYHTSTKGKMVASIIQKHLLASMKLKDRGLKAIQNDDRGANLLRKTKAPAVITEGCFITAMKDTHDRDTKLQGYVDGLVAAIHELGQTFQK